MSFVPLAPSFVSAPFESLCAMPRIEQVAFTFNVASGESRTETRFRMSEDFIERWNAEEKRIVDAAHIIMLRYGINANPPPRPSSFNYDRAHKSHRMAKRMICLSREWFAIWMGYLSYLIAKTSTLIPNGVPDQSSPLPDWYNHLRNEHKFSLAWLDASSSLLSAHSTEEPHELGLYSNGRRRADSESRLIGTLVITFRYFSSGQGKKKKRFCTILP
jgi:hypothetical protein